MHCPRCRTEHEQGVMRCPHCAAELTEGPPPPRATAQWVELVTVLETADPSLLLVAKSLLDAENVPAFAEGQGVQEALGAGRIAESDIPMGPGRLRVHPEDVEAARELLANLQPLRESEEQGT